MPAVLVVEDERAVRRVLRLMLGRTGYTVAEADSVASATDALEAFGYTFDLILLDLNLPDETGWELLRQINSRVREASDADDSTRSPAVIVMTAVRPAQCRLDEFHPAALLLKPFPIEALIRLVERVLSRSTLAG